MFRKIEIMPILIFEAQCILVYLSSNEEINMVFILLARGQFHTF